MSGLRERQRADRHRRILEAAAALFRESGYEGAKIEAIATEAEVSVGTIYNYYRNKGDILVAIVSMEVNEVLNAGRGVVASPPRNVADAIDVLIGGYIDHSLIYLSKAMWRQAMATSTQQPDSPFGKTYAALDHGLADQTCELVERLKGLGLVRPETDVRSAGEIIFNNMNMMFIEFVKQEAMPLEQLRAAIRRQNDVLVGAIAG
ncbi:TetR/AcrR family transcriptional regulator [Mesorhizobium sp. YM1C-6-2]|uniref:TetR/AcrR family transcriptional regulator n=1 Tax=Mesorhizobium sp. YM1C-6-2 TaxID=1827501 RepID=UPI000EF22051|nr:TetR/AcrR family transcriptional regulator [Mesorhizobium sp. YM1C-6-2]RLP27930.1 TetR/AcrR family transcriptional regulator [Mesorhizobium sp. YM1C-6-2]